MVPASDTTSPKLSGHFADFNESGKIMFISQPEGMYSACFGGLMAARAHHLGAAAVVVDGRVRDIREIQGFGLPVSFLFFALRFGVGLGVGDLGGGDGSTVDAFNSFSRARRRS